VHAPLSKCRIPNPTLNWLPPGLLRLGETRNEKGPSRSYRAWLRHEGVGGVALEVLEEDSPKAS